MAITVAWDNEEKTIVRWDFEGKWTWDDFRAVQIESDEMIVSVGHTVHVIANVQRSPVLPANPSAGYKRLQRHSPENRGMIVVVGANTFIQSMLGVFNKVYGERLADRFLVANTLDQARALIAGQSQHG